MIGLSELHPKPPSRCSCTNMRRAARAVTRFYDEMLTPSGLKTTQYSLLSHLQRLGPLSMNALSAAIRLERTTLVRNLKPLESMGLVAVAAGKGPKAGSVRLTEDGGKTLALAAPYWRQAQEHLQTLLTKEERYIFGTVLQKLESLVP